ncbi:hypothetical protein EHP00_1373 [Ecytonucleospora hepatopenaei]|uniref:Uncharacterized protein n=1 Tax=Ecytonucleospora hepatopenaei TaxID=646526 RepID=A0A1W0E2X4_9MICR|nr:hypothetical protein EHP00_1373 [Ecytonucleospora hepatopenaei]
MVKKEINIEKQEQHVKKVKQMSPLQLAIKNGDTDYISNFINRLENTPEENSSIKTLNKNEKIKLAKMTVEFLKEENKLNAMKILHILVTDVGCANGIAKALLEVQIDIKKLLFLKGKIEYLIFKGKNKQSNEPLEIIEEE